MLPQSTRGSDWFGHRSAAAASSRRGVYRRRRIGAGASFAIAGLALPFALACATPGTLYGVAPEISGRLRSERSEVPSVELELDVLQRENASLFARQRAVPDADGRFAFGVSRLAVAGREYSKRYRVYLHYRDGAQDRVIWRAEFSRLDAVAPIQLDCALDRPSPDGQPCSLVDAAQQRWFVAEGEATYRKHCNGCHGDAHREPSADERLTGPDLSAIALRNGGRFDRAAVAERIDGRSLPPAHGSAAMPAWGERLHREYEPFIEGDQLIGAQLDPLVAYLESIQRRD